MGIAALLVAPGGPPPRYGSRAETPDLVISSLADLFDERTADRG